MTTTKTAMPPPPDWALVEAEGPYHFLSKTGECLSSGMLKKFRECPYVYRQIVFGAVAEKDSNAFRFGRAVHKIVLEGIPAFNKSYHIDGPINPKTNKAYGPDTQAFANWLAENSIHRECVVTQEEADTLVAMANAVRRHETATAYLDFGWPELVARTLLHGEMCQIRMDWLTHDASGNHIIIDLKTTEDISWFESDARRYGYPHQFAFYRDVLHAVSGIAAQVVVIVAEKKAPFRVGVWNIPPEVLDLYSAENALAIADYSKCKKTNTWPTGYEEVRDFGMARA